MTLNNRPSLLPLNILVTLLNWPPATNFEPSGYVLIDVPDDALITEPNRVGRTMVWPLRFAGQIFIRCFMPGNMG